MSTQNDFISRLNLNLQKTMRELLNGEWRIIFDEDDDEFTWYNPLLKSSENSLLLPIDNNFFGVSISKDRAEIEYINIQYFSLFVKENPEFQQFYEILKKRNHPESTENQDPLMDHLLNTDRKEKIMATLAGRLFLAGVNFQAA